MGSKGTDADLHLFTHSLRSYTLSQHGGNKAKEYKGTVAKARAHDPTGAGRGLPLGPRR